jgi:uncharacterized protein with von Willebrand factor type A (vWA) domain
MYPFASLPENLAAFCETLRRHHGFHIGPGELHDAARALDIVDVADERAVRHALRPILASTLDDTVVFDAAFTQFFLRGSARVPQDQLPSRRSEPGVGADGRETDAERGLRAPPSDADAREASGPSGGPMIPIESTGDALEGAAMLARASYSPLAANASEAPELPRIEQAWHDAARVFVRQLHLGLSRRWKPSSQGRRFDLRRTLRASLQTGGEALSARWLRRPRHAPRIVLLVDGSRSMSAYARITLKIAVALASATMRVEVFTFSTRLKRVTVDVRRAAAGESRRLERLHEAWAGGTAIGACLREFLQRFGERMVGRDTVVMIASDGLDVGVPGLLRDTMRDLHRRSAGVVWLNPLLETEGYEPTAAGMNAARPYITTFTSINNQGGLARLSRVVRLRA